MTLLKAETISKRFGGLAALFKVSFSVDPGEILGIIGPNGAGKTTLFNCLSGMEIPDEGRILYYGEDVTGLSPHKIVKRGMVRTFQTTRVFRDLTVLENVMVGAQLHSKSNLLLDMLRLPKAKAEDEGCAESALDALDMVRLRDMAGKMAASLTVSQARRMELARALATRPRLLLLDEPGAGLDEGEKEGLKELLREVKRRGITLMVIDHDIGLVVDLCASIIVLNFGKIIVRGTPKEIQSNRDVLDAYLGDADEC